MRPFPRLFWSLHLKSVFRRNKAAIFLKMWICIWVKLCHLKLYIFIRFEVGMRFIVDFQGLNSRQFLSIFRPQNSRFVVDFSAAKNWVLTKFYDFEKDISWFEAKYGVISKNKPSLELFVVFCYIEKNSKLYSLKVCKINTKKRRILHNFTGAIL